MVSDNQSVPSNSTNDLVGADHASTCRVFVCDDQVDIREALSEIIERLPGFEKVGEAADGDGLLAGLRSTNADVIILDVSMPRGGPQIAREVKDMKPEVKIVVFTAHRDERTKAEMLAAGADDFVVKTGRLQPLRQALDRIVREIPRQS